MARNGERRPPRPRIELVGGAPSDDEGAAIVAALKRFLAETVSPTPAESPPSPWQRAALAEGVSAKRFAHPPGPAHRPQSLLGG
jgi:hypothetical protein